MVMGRSPRGGFPSDANRSDTCRADAGFDARSRAPVTSFRDTVLSIPKSTAKSVVKRLCLINGETSQVEYGVKMSGQAGLPGRNKVFAHRSGSDYCNFAYSDLACVRMGTSGSASFQRVRKSLYAARDLGSSAARA